MERIAELLRETPDIQSALNNWDASAWMGSDPQTGERIVAASAPIIYHGQIVAVEDWILEA